VKTLLIDGNNLCYQAFFTMGDLSNEEIRVGVIYGFTRKIQYLSQKYKTSRFIFYFDSQRNQRKKIYPEYKAKRRENPVPGIEHLYDQISLLRKEILPELGFKNIFIQAGYESDDLIAHTTLEQRNKQYIIVSNDNDLWQLLDYHVEIHNSKGNLLNLKWFMDTYSGLHPWYWGQIKAVMGCTTDNVVGVNGVGEKTATKYFCGELKKGKAFEAIESSKEIIDRNRKLVHLPFKGNPPIEIKIKKDGL